MISIYWIGFFVFLGACIWTVIDDDDLCFDVTNTFAVALWSFMWPLALLIIAYFYFRDGK